MSDDKNETIEPDETPKKPDPLGKEQVSHVFRWDLDKTYLNTDFDSFSGLVKIAFEKAKDKENVPGAAALLQGLSKYTESSTPPRIYFVSGSPRQMRKVLERKLKLDGIDYHKLSLKPNLENLAKGRFRAIKEQVGYKLPLLLKGRVPYLPEVKETLFGDDAESDAFIYSLYADFVSGIVQWEEVLAVFEACGVYPRSLATAETAAKQIQHGKCVEQVFINLDRRSSPTRFKNMHPIIVPVYNYWQAALCLYAKKRLSYEGTAAVAESMIEHYNYTLPRLQNSTEDLMRRAHLPTKRLDQWLEAQENSERQSLMLNKLALRLGRLQSLSLPNKVKTPRKAPDYLALFEAEKEAKRLAKLAAKADKKAKTDFEMGD